MAPKKKKADMDDITKAKVIVNKAARVVNDAVDAEIERVARRKIDSIFGKQDWAQTQQEVNALDEEFKADEGATFADVLKNKFRSGDVEVRVMRIEPDGTYTDVSDKVSPKDLRPESVEGIQIGDSRTPIGRNPQSKADALRLLQELLPALQQRQRSQLRSGFDLSRGGATSESIRKMELVLAESDKILEHWKK